MLYCRVDGNIVSSACHPSMCNFRTVICQPLDENGADDSSPPVLALDPLGAGLHQRVLLSTDGSSTRALVRDDKSPLRNMIVAVLDEESTEG